MTFFSTKCWEMRGIEMFSGAVVAEVYASSYGGSRFERVGRDAFFSREEAVENARKKISAKLKALDRRIKAVRKFEKELV